MDRHVTVALALLCWATCTAALYSSSSPVTSLDSSNFKAKLKNAQIALVEFYAPWCGHCKVLQPDYEKVAKAMKGSMMVAAVDADQHKDLGGEYGIQGFPTIKFMYMEGDKVKTVDYPGQRTAKDIIPWAFEKAKNLALKRIGEKSSGSKPSGGPKAGGSSGGGADSFYGGTDVVTLSDNNFADEVTSSNDLWLVEFYAPWCGHCKNLKPEWIDAAASLQGKVKLGAVDCTQHQSTCSEYGVQGYPTIKFFGQRKSSPEDYQGPREALAIVQWATDKWSRVAPPPEVRELTDPSVWEKACAGQDGRGAASLCLLAFLPDILEAKASGRNRHIAVLQRVADKYKDRRYGWLWAQGGAQAGLEESLQVGGFGYPALVAFIPKDNKYILAKGAFGETGIIDFLEGLKYGRNPVQMVQGELNPIDSITPWDGKDAVIQVEDEFSLDDLEEL